MATRVFELAREIGVTSKVVLEKCRAEGLEIKNHMSTVSAGLEATIREWFSEAGGEHTAVETTEHVDLDTARKEAKKTRRRAPKKKKAKKDAPVADAEPGDDEAAAVTIAEALPDADVPAEAPADVEAGAAPEPQAPAEVPADAEALEGEPEAPEEPQAEVEPEPEDVGPAGPQVVPKPAELKGPRVVRYEEPEPEVQRRPRRRPASTPAASAAPSTESPTRRGWAGKPDAGKSGPGKPGAPGRGGDDRGKGAGTKRRSPRRRGRSADSGGGSHEWRNADLAERSERLAAAAGGSGALRRHRASVTRGRGDRGPAVKGGTVEIDEPITIKSLSAATGIKATDLIKKLMALGTMATVNQVISADVAEMAVTEFGVELQIKRARSDEEQLLTQLDEREKGEEVPRAPVVTFLGHVDHGKTSLLDAIRETTVATGEAGGITQHIGAYRFDLEDKHVVFLDTPGHEAFTAMRSRGANMTDVVVLVVAADDGVMPQTAEAISHAKAAEVPIVVALNKVDLPNANVNRVLGQLAEYELQPREWGGETEVIQTSATTGDGIDTLVETLSLEAELLELTAEVNAPAGGYVIEAEVDPGRGAVASLLVLDGTLSVGDVILAGHGYGRVRSMIDSHGRQIETAAPATPVEVAGLDEVPEAGDRFYVTRDIDKARSVAQERREQSRSKSLSGGTKVSLENIFSQIEQGRISEVRLIIKADVQGSLEALTGSLDKLTTDEVRVNILHAAVGGISTGDVGLAEASDAIIIGFNVVPAVSARREAEAKGVDIRQYRVIYDLIDDIRRVLEEGLAPEIREQFVGRAEIRQTFKISRTGTIAGCYVTEGRAVRNAFVRIVRDSVVLEDERTLDSLKRFKDDAREVRAGMECGLKIAGYDDIKEGDELEFYERIEVERKL